VGKNRPGASHIGSRAWARRVLVEILRADLVPY
jgi:hypothetical protein